MQHFRVMIECAASQCACRWMSQILGIKGRISKLQEMLNRNRNDKVLAGAVGTG